MLHNAGKSQRARWEHTDIKVDLDLFNLNVFSIVNLSRCIMPHFLERNSGTFALMSSTAGKAGVPFSGSYTGSKHALHVSHESNDSFSPYIVAYIDLTDNDQHNQPICTGFSPFLRIFRVSSTTAKFLNNRVDFACHELSRNVTKLGQKLLLVIIG